MNDRDYQDGYSVGLAWAHDEAQPAELDRMARYFDRKPVEQLRTTIVKSAATVVLWLASGEPCGHVNDDMPDGWWRGFVQGTLDIREAYLAPAA